MFETMAFSGRNFSCLEPIFSEVTFGSKLEKFSKKLWLHQFFVGKATFFSKPLDLQIFYALGDLDCSRLVFYDSILIFCRICYMQEKLFIP